MTDRQLISHFCIGANAELEASAPISLIASERGNIKVVCPFYASERCLAKVEKRADLDVVKGQVNRHRNSPEANSYPTCIYVSEGVRLV